MSEPITVITWKDGLSIGVDEIDREHRWLVADFNAVVNAVKIIDDRRFVEKMFDCFIATNAGHFEHEEAAMAAAGFEDLEVHRERHQNYLGRLEGLREKVRAGADVSGDLTSYFLSWLNHHVAVTDRKFGDFLASRGAGGTVEEEFVSFTEGGFTAAEGASS